MIIAPTKILELNSIHHFIEPLSERELDPEGAGIDIRVGEVYQLKEGGYLGVHDRKTPDIHTLASLQNGDKEITIQPGDFLLLKTIEKINLPGEKIALEEGKKAVHLMIQLYPRTTLHRCGLYLMGTKVDPGYHGELTLALKHLGHHPFRLELGARVVNLVFHTVKGELGRAYDGQYKGGRVTSKTIEKQN